MVCETWVCCDTDGISAVEVNIILNVACEQCWIHSLYNDLKIDQSIKCYRNTLDVLHVLAH